jgi:hypothetical protein
VATVVVVVGGTEVVVVVVVGATVVVVVVEGSVVVVVVGATVVVVVVVVGCGPVVNSSGESDAERRASNAAGSRDVGTSSACVVEAKNDALASRPEASPRPSGSVSEGALMGASAGAGEKTANPATDKATRVMPAAVRTTKRRMTRGDSRPEVIRPEVRVCRSAAGNKSRPAR